jgi:hypothetical protein
LAGLVALMPEGSDEPVMWMTRPQRCPCMAGSQACVSRRTAVKFSVQDSSQPAFLITKCACGSIVC